MRLRGGAVLSARRWGPRAAVIRSLARENDVDLHWSLGWNRVRATVGGNPTLVEAGRVVVRSSSHPFFRRNPRTGVGTTPDGRVLMITVDGRRRRYSRGITLRGFARLFRSLGANWALNLDGGGSTTMVVRGRVINRPSDGPERPVSSALLIVPAGASARPASLGTSSGEGVAGSKVWDEVVTDPASTGGFISSLRERGAKLPSRLLEAARAFERRG
ncbi:MAG: phosphodiester glycosidase family protein [Actinomycetota bacterium]